MACHFARQPLCGAKFLMECRAEPFRPTGAGFSHKAERVPKEINHAPILSRDRVFAFTTRSKLGALPCSRLMYDLDCPICLNSFSFENFRSLPCGMSLRMMSLYCYCIYPMPLLLVT